MERKLVCGQQGFEITKTTQEEEEKRENHAHIPNLPKDHIRITS